MHLCSNNIPVPSQTNRPGSWLQKRIFPSELELVYSILVGAICKRACFGPEIPINTLAYRPNRVIKLVVEPPDSYSCGWRE